MNQQLQDYIIKLRQEGKTDDQIRQELLKTSKDPLLIDNLLDSLETGRNSLRESKKQAEFNPSLLFTALGVSLVILSLNYKTLFSCEGFCFYLLLTIPLYIFLWSILTVFLAGMLSFMKPTLKMVGFGNYILLWLLSFVGILFFIGVVMVIVGIPKNW